jgi:hypothetical protein
MAHFAEVIIGPLRIGSTAATLEVLFSEPLLFAAHYTTVADILDLPEEIEAMLAAVRTRYGAHDAVLELIDTLRSQVPLALSADLARRMAEGLELHTALKNTPNLYREACTEPLAHHVKGVTANACPEETTPGGRQALLARLLDFSPAQTQVMAYTLVYTVVPALQLVHLRVVDVVARAQGQGIRLLRQGRQRMLMQRLHMRSQRPVRERLIRPVHGQERLPAWLMGQ